jgi:glycosyltransferase involved in cell wall biosynthesis
MTHRKSFRLSVIVCAHNEARFLPACLHSLLAQTRVPDEIVVINNASTDETRAVAEQIPGVSVVNEARKGLVVARETGRRAATGDILVYLDADCRAPLTWLERIERRFTYIRSGAMGS